MSFSIANFNKSVIKQFAGTKTITVVAGSDTYTSNQIVKYYVDGLLVTSDVTYTGTLTGNEIFLPLTSIDKVNIV